jgi:hypothetical protein
MGPKGSSRTIRELSGGLSIIEGVLGIVSIGFYVSMGGKAYMR